MDYDMWKSIEKSIEKSPDATASAPPRAAKRETSRSIAIAFLIVFLFICWQGIQYETNDPSSLLNDFENQNSYKAHALRILERNPLIDGHNDLAISIRAKYGNKICDKNFTEPFEHGGMKGHVDIPRIDAGKYGGAFWSVFWLCPANPYDFSTEAYDPIVRATLHQIDLLRRLSSMYPHYFPSTPSSTMALSSFRKQGIHIAPLGIEGLHQIGNSYSNLRLFYDLGVRYSTLNWNCHNLYTDAAVITFLLNGTSVPAQPLHGGVSTKGRQLIREMNRIGMIVDLAHVSVDTMRDVLIGEHNAAFPFSQSESDEIWTGSLAPPIVSHSSAHAICPHPRNIPDSILPLIKQRNSVVMVNFSPDFISCHLPDGADPMTTLPITDAEGATLDKVVEHIMYIGERVGYEHVGIGSDFDGIDTTPKGLEGVDKMPDLVAELLARGLSEKDVIGVVGGNVLRVWGEVEKVSERLQKSGMRPAEDELPGKP